MKTYSITLPDDVAAMLDEAVAAGLYASPDEMVLNGIVLAADTSCADEHLDKEWLRKELQIGVDQLDRGEGIDGPTFMAGLLKRAEQKALAARQPT